MIIKKAVHALRSLAVELRIANALTSGTSLPDEYRYSSNHPYNDWTGYLRVLREQFESDLNNG